MIVGLATTYCIVSIHPHHLLRFQGVLEVDLGLGDGEEVDEGGGGGGGLDISSLDAYSRFRMFL